MLAFWVWPRVTAQMLHNSFPASACRTPFRFCFTRSSADKKSSNFSLWTHTILQQSEINTVQVNTGLPLLSLSVLVPSSDKQSSQWLHQWGMQSCMRVKLIAILPGRVLSESKSSKTKKQTPLKCLQVSFLLQASKDWSTCQSQQLRWRNRQFGGQSTEIWVCNSGVLFQPCSFSQLANWVRRATNLM